MRRPVPFLVLLALVASGCSLLGLDRFEFPRCDPMTGCAVLNARDGIADSACELWQCDRDGQSCEFGPRDRDYDTVLALGCTVDGVVGTDCNDGDDEISPMASEACNGRDDDCNGLIDDGAMGSVAPLVVVEGPLSRPTAGVAHVAYADVPGGVAFAAALVENAAVGAAVTASAPAVPSTAVVPLSLTTSADPTDVGDLGTAPGCSRHVFAPLPTPRSCTVDADCTVAGVSRCVTLPDSTRVCERPVIPRVPAPLPTDCTAHFECSDGIRCNGEETCEPRSDPSQIDARGCRLTTTPACTAGTVCSEADATCGSVVTGSCAPADFAIAPTSSSGFLSATIAESGCRAGVVMLGRFALTATEAIPMPNVGSMLSRGPDVRSTSWTGLDVDQTTACTGSSRPAMSPAGAAGIAMATLEPRLAMPGLRRRPQGLVAYLAAHSCRGVGSCTGTAPGGTGPVDVEVAGVWLEESLVGTTPVEWVTATGTGIPVALGVMTDGDVTRVGVAAFDASDAGYLVAYPTAAGGIAVHAVAALDDPASECFGGVDCVVGAMPSPCASGESCVATASSPTGGRCTVYPCVSTEAPYRTLIAPAPPAPSLPPPRTMAELVVPPATLLFASAAPTGSAAIATHVPPGDPSVRVLVAWPEASAVVVGTADLDPSTGALTGAVVLATVPSTAPTQVAVAHVASGIAVLDASVGGTTVTADDRGGFVVTWRDDGGTRALRVADVTGDVVGPGAATIGTATTAPRGFSAADGSLQVLARDGETMVVFPAVCGP